MSVRETEEVSQMLVALLQSDLEAFALQGDGLVWCDPISGVPAPMEAVA